jgi:hypothetical protein
MSDEWIKRQKPEKDNGEWIGQPWPTSPWALFKDVNGIEAMAEKLTADDYYFYGATDIDIKRLCMFKELTNDHPIVKKYLENKTNWNIDDLKCAENSTDE